jgi:hypothetical protein
VFGAVDWSSVHVAGAFVLGAVAVMRITRHLLEYLRRERDDN